MNHAGPGPKRVVLDEPLDKLVHSHVPEVLRAVAASEDLDEELALLLLSRRDLPQGVIDAVVKNVAVMKHRKVINAVVAHPRTPRHISVPIARRLYTFELMQIALTPAVPADVKRAVEDVLVSRLATISSGERITLARRASSNVAAALLFDPEPRIIEIALQSPFITTASASWCTWSAATTSGRCGATCASRCCATSTRRRAACSSMRGRCPRTCCTIC
jgi:hypothetical protein